MLQTLWRVLEILWTLESDIYSLEYAKDSLKSGKDSCLFGGFYGSTRDWRVRDGSSGPTGQNFGAAACHHNFSKCLSEFRVKLG